MNITEDKEKLLERIAELEQKIHNLEKDLAHDKLTTLKTRDYFEKKSKNFLDQTKKIKKGERREWAGFRDVSFLFFDIDHFKKVNDTYGHDIGDKVLVKFAQVLKENFRIGDIIARWGGEEYIVILLGSGEKESRNVAEKIRRKVESMVFDEQKNLKITVSVGVAEFNEHITLEELVKNADKALYNAKETGRNKVVTFSEIFK